MYPQGCDVCNHLSLFLCVADYDKLLPGELVRRSGRVGRLCSVHHAACAAMFRRLEPLRAVHDSCCEQGAEKIQVLRYECIRRTEGYYIGISYAFLASCPSDTLHRFCKKEHDWGWKKFMELSKVLDGFTVADTLVIKAQVQVIL